MSEIQTVMSAYRPVLRRQCYEPAARLRPDLAGRMTLKFVVAPDGQVQSVDIATDMRDEAFVACVRASAKRLRFPRALESTTFSVPQQFAPR